jgi:hypothetical protein
MSDEGIDFWDKAERGDFDAMTPKQLKFMVE